VAREAGVSKTTVSFALNAPSRVKPATAARVREVATRLGYEPHPVARLLAQRRAQTIGLLTPQALSVMFANPFFAAFSEGVASVTEENGYALQFISPLRGSLAGAVNRSAVDGVVAIGLSGDHPEVEQIRRARLPTVLVDSTPFNDQPLVDIDDVGAAEAAAQHLLEHGHRAFLVVGLAAPHPTTPLDPDGVLGRRLTGYRRALERAGVRLEPEDVVVAPASIPGGHRAFQAAWSEGRRPTAVLAMSDAVAIGVIRAAGEVGLRVPTDLSVVGFDDIDLAELVDPPLTTVRQPVRRKGREATQLLFEAISGGSDHQGDRRRLATELVIRGSTAAAPSRPPEGVPIRTHS
jgi:DNA-binding LacI/PurR family transcriptional regulator